MGKLLVLSLSDCEEHIFNRVMAAIIDEPELDRIALPLSDASLSFPNIEIRLKEQTVFCRGQLVTLTHHEFAVLAYLARHPGWVFSASEPTEFNLYSETAHFYIWLRLVTRHRDYNAYVHYYLKG